jgi:retron-type reverse transcriptase
MWKCYVYGYEGIISLENLLAAWQEFVVGKRSRKDVQEFEQTLMENLFALHDCLSTKTYMHSSYEAFGVSDPKPRSIHKATVFDRVLHRALYRKLYPFFDRLFIADSFSCRVGKGTHRALDRFRTMAGRVSRNHTRTCWVLKCDIRKFFASIDHEVLLSILAARISDKDVLWLLGQVIGSFSSGTPGVGLPLGNLTSQLFANVVMDHFDQFVKHRLKVRHYVRYADDFVFLSEDRDWLVERLPEIRDFLSQELRLTLHPDKVFIKTFASGVDFLGWVHFPDHRVLRTATKRRMLRRLAEHPTEETLQSYLGLMRHGNAKRQSLSLRGSYSTQK